MLQRLNFVLLTTMCIMIKTRIIVADTKNVLMENDTVSPLSEQPEFEPHPYSGPGSSMGITYDSKILADKSARKLLKSLSLSPSSATKIMALSSAATHSKATPPPEPPKPSKPFRIPIPFVPRPVKVPAPPAPTTLLTQPESPASHSIPAPLVSTSPSSGTPPPELPKSSPIVVEPTAPEKSEKTSQSLQSISPISQDAQKPFKLFKWPNLFGSKSTKPATSYKESEPKKPSDSITTSTYSPPIESSTHSTTVSSINLPVQSSTPAYLETVKPSRFFKFPNIFVPKPIKSPTPSSNEHELSNTPAQTTSKVLSKPSPPIASSVSVTSVVPTSTLPEAPTKLVEPQTQNITPTSVETSKPPVVFKVPDASTLKPFTTSITEPKPSDLSASSTSAAVDSSAMSSATETSTTPTSSATSVEPSTQSKTHGPVEITKPSNKFSFSSLFGPKPTTKPLAPILSGPSTPLDKPPPNLVTEAQSPVHASSTSVETASPSTPASALSTPTDQTSTFTSLESSLGSLKSALLLPPSPSRISRYPTMSLQSPSVSAGPLIDQSPSASPSVASSTDFSPPSDSSLPQHSSLSSSSLSSSLAPTGFSLTAPLSSSISSSFSSSASFKSPSSSFSSSASFKSPSSSFSSSVVSSGASASTPTSPTKFGSNPVKSSSRFNFNKFLGSIMDGFASIGKPRSRRAEDRWSSTRRSLIDEEDDISMIHQNLETNEHAEPRTETKAEKKEDNNKLTVKRESGSDKVEDRIFSASAHENMPFKGVSDSIIDEGPSTKIQKLNGVEDRNLHTTLLREKENEVDLAINKELNTNKRDKLSYNNVTKNSSEQIFHGHTVENKFRIKQNSNENTSMEKHLNNINFENQAMAQDLQHIDSLSENKMTMSKAVNITPSEILTRATNNKDSPSKEGQTERQYIENSENFSIHSGQNLR